jgi:hypothetical protein
MTGSHIRHGGGLNQTVIELGFDTVKFFEGTITTTPLTISITPPARRLILRNTGNTAVWLNITGDAAAATASLTPGDNIKIDTNCTFNMDFDTLTSISLVTGSSSTTVEGTIGFKGIV